MLEGVLGVDYDEAAAREQPRREAAVVAMLGPEPDLDWIDGCHPVQLPLYGGRLVEVDWVEADWVNRKLAVAHDVRRRVGHRPTLGADLIVIHYEIPLDAKKARQAIAS